MTKVDTIIWYKAQLVKFNKIGLGNKTEFNTIVTNTLINATKRRLEQLILNNTIEQQ